jgi:type IX secretion system PorP/SprF family membrane protein
MMKQDLKSIFLLMILFAGSAAHAQDFHLTQYDGAPLYLNPGLTGLFQGKHRVCGAYRSQWSSITPNEFVTVGLSYDQKVRKYALGFQMMNERAGTGSYNVFGLNLNGAYDIPFGKSKFNHVSLGLNAGVIQKSVNIAQLTFDEQYRYTNGGGFDQGMGNGESQGGQNIILPDVGVGAVYYYSNDMSRLNPFAGASAFHLNRPNESFYSGNNKLPIRYAFHTGVKFSASNRYQLIPKMLFMRQSNAQEISTSLISHYYLEGSDSYLIFGPTWRNKDAMIMEFGLKLNTFTYRVSYDVNYSSLQTATNRRGGFEFSVVYTSRKPAPSRVPSCPRL